MNITIKRINDDFLMEAANANGNIVLMDGSKEIGGGEAAMRPMQLLLSALGGCSAIDVIAILKKQKQQIDAFEIEVEGAREKIEEYSIFRNIILHYKITGAVDFQKAERAVALSLEKYCSVSKMIENISTISHKITIIEP